MGLLLYRTIEHLGTTATTNSATRCQGTQGPVSPVGVAQNWFYTEQAPHYHSDAEPDPGELDFFFPFPLDPLFFALPS